MVLIPIGKELRKRDQEDIKRTEINTKKEWENIVEKVKKGVDKNPILTYI